MKRFYNRSMTQIDDCMTRIRSVEKKLYQASKRNNIDEMCIWSHCVEKRAKELRELLIAKSLSDKAFLVIKESLEVDHE